MTDNTINCYSTDGELFHTCDGVEDALDNDECACEVGSVDPVDLDKMAGFLGTRLAADAFDGACSYLFDIVGDAAEGNPDFNETADAMLKSEFTDSIRRWLAGRVHCYAVKNIRSITEEERSAWEAKDPWKRPLDAEGGAV